MCGAIKCHTIRGRIIKMQVVIPVHEDICAEPVRTITILRGPRRGIWRKPEEVPKPSCRLQSSCASMGMGGSGKGGGCGKKKHRRTIRKKGERKGRKECFSPMV